VLGQEGLSWWRVAPPATLIDTTPHHATSSRTGSVIVALKPLSLDSNFPPEIWTSWFETILDGTLFRLYGMPAKPWSNTALATYHGTRFRQGINRARGYAVQQYSNQQAWRFPLFAHGRRKQ
jgi:hypothetical protein